MLQQLRSRAPRPNPNFNALNTIIDIVLSGTSQNGIWRNMWINLLLRLTLNRGHFQSMLQMILLLLRTLRDLTVLLRVIVIPVISVRALIQNSTICF